MGCFSWKFCNKKDRLRIDGEAFVICPAPGDGLEAGTVLHETCYDGYGRFDGHDIYELVADWNKPYLSVYNVEMPDRRHWADDERGDLWYEEALERYKKRLKKMRDFINNKPDDYMRSLYGNDWKRKIGIDIACYNEDNASLHYPIKIFSRRLKPSEKWEDFSPSEDDPDQGL